MDEVCFRDKRLAGSLDLFKHIHTFELDGNTSVFSAFNFLKARQKLIGRKLSKLYIFCHGITNSSSLTILGHTKKYDKYFTGKIQLGKEMLTLSTVPNWIFIRNLVDNIIVYACMAGHTSKTRKGTIADGKMLMKLLAIKTNAYVYASERSQVYTPELMQFKKWEGRVYQFNPNGKIVQVSGGAVQALTGKI
ncbi:MAG: hypothetical protein HKN33_15465 [Pyrinomonadaceae bacterium]|nr:hypothetical protein [Pyrinomonadaceae bacterium]